MERFHTQPRIRIDTGHVRTVARHRWVEHRCLGRAEPPPGGVLRCPRPTGERARRRGARCEESLKLISIVYQYYNTTEIQRRS